MPSIHGMGASPSWGASGDTPQQSLEDLLQQLSSLASNPGSSGGSGLLPQIQADIQNIRANMNSFPPGTFNNGFLLDLCSSPNSGLLNQMMNAMQNNDPSTTLSGYAMAIESQFTGDNGSSILQNLEQTLNAVAALKGGYPSEFLNQFESSVLALGLLQPSGLSSSFEQDLSQFMSPVGGSNSLIAQLASAMQENDLNTAGPMALALLAQISGDNGNSILQSLESVLNTLSTLSPNSPMPTSLVNAFQQDILALGYLQPSGLSSSFEQDLSLFMNQNPNKSNTLIGQMWQALSQGNTSSAASLAKQLLAEIQGS